MKTTIKDLKRYISADELRSFRGGLTEYLKIENNRLDTKDVDGETILHWIARYGRNKMADQLLKFAIISEQNKPVVEARNKEEETPLMLAAKCGHLEMVRILLANRADVNAHKMGSTALVKAASCGRKHIVMLLLVNGARDPHAIALSSAVSRGYKEIVELLKQYATPKRNDIMEKYARTSGVLLGLLTRFNRIIFDIIKEYLFRDIEYQQVSSCAFDSVTTFFFDVSPVRSITPGSVTSRSVSPGSVRSRSITPSLVTPRSVRSRSVITPRSTPSFTASLSTLSTALSTPLSPSLSTPLSPLSTPLVIAERGGRTFKNTWK